MTKKTPAVAHEFGLVAPAPDGVADAIAEIMLRHRDELDAALAPFGVELEDLMDPTWMRAIYFEDVEPFEPLVKHIEPEGVDAAAIMRLVDGGVASLESMSLTEAERLSARNLLAPRGACCGETTACSPEFCGGDRV